MRIFTKSLLTFLLLCVAGVVNAQVKGWFELDVQAFANEARDGKRVECQPARTIDGGYVVYARSKEDAAAAGDMPVSSADKDKTDVANYVDWDTQFFLQFPADYAVPENGKFRLRMKIKADNAIQIGTQSHGNAGNYMHWACIGDVPFTDEWSEYDSGEKTADSNMKNFHCIAFQLGKGDENTFYFKDVILEVYGDKPATPTALSENFKWTELVNNNDCEGEDNSSFLLRQYPYAKGDLAQPTTIVDGAGKDGTRGVRFSSNDMVDHEWDTQYWIKFNEAVPAGTKLWVKFDYRSENELVNTAGETVKIPTQSHTIMPGGIWEDGDDSYIWYSLLGDIPFTTEWQTFENDNFVVSTDQAKEGRPMGSIAFNMNQFNPANTYYFDNMSVKKGALLNDVINDEVGGFRVLFTEYTNMPDVVKSIVGKKRRVVLTGDQAKAIAKVTVDGAEAPVETVEFDKDGTLYVFLSEDYGSIAEGAKVVLSFTNSTDAKYQLLYTRGDNINKPVEDFEMESAYDSQANILPSSWLSPELESSEPEEGSFCLPANQSEFKLTFDKAVKANKIKAKLDDKEDLVVTGDAEHQEIVTLTRKLGAAALAEGKHTISITNVFSVNDDNEYEDSPAELTFSVGAAAMNPKLERALASARTVLEDSELDERYQGEAYAALKAAVEKYEAEGATYTAPSQLQDALDDLTAKNEAQTQHFNRCKSYDENLAGAEELVETYGESKFAAHPLYTELAAAVGKYHGKVLTDDTELDAAIKDLESNVNTAKAMFTTGKPKQGTTGIAALVERIRLGAETLKETFNASDDDELIVAANNALTDDDELAGRIKDAIREQFYMRAMLDGDNFYEESEDAEGNIVKSGPNMTVFIKNPNIYRLSKNMEINTGDNAVNIPLGWTINSGSTKLSDGWSQANADIADSMFEGWGATFDISQEISDLPAGTYKVNFAMGERQKGNSKKKVVNEETGEEEEVMDDEKNEADLAGIYAYYKTSADEEIVKKSAPHIGQSFPTLAQNRIIFDEIVVTDGKLTLGFHGEGASIFFEEIELTLVGRAEGVDYSGLYTGVETVKTAAGKAVYYDLQGRRVAKPTKGLYIKSGKKLVVK